MFVCVIVGGKKNCKMDEVERIKALKAKGKVIGIQKLTIFVYLSLSFNLFL